MLGILSKRYRLQLPGLDEVAPKHPTLGDVDSPEALAQLPGRQARPQGRDARRRGRARRNVKGGRTWALAGLPCPTA